jgi:hypothetical protein
LVIALWLYLDTTHFQINFRARVLVANNFRKFSILCAANNLLLFLKNKILKNPILILFSLIKITCFHPNFFYPTTSIIAHNHIISIKQSESITPFSVSALPHTKNSSFIIFLLNQSSLISILMESAKISPLLLAVFSTVVKTQKLLFLIGTIIPD